MAIRFVGQNTSKNRGGKGSAGRTTKRRVAVGTTSIPGSTAEYYSYTWQTSGTNTRKKNAAKRKKK